MIFKPKQDGDDRQWEQVSKGEEGTTFTLVDWNTFERILHGMSLNNVPHLEVGSHERIKQIIVTNEGIAVFKERRDA